ncbi:hypothetical protein FQN57_005667 [Myotisia sp. PD_48]|nr:hypothetical protein FQN57_005667 [Myotisia sp. PD_48]
MASQRGQLEPVVRSRKGDLQLSYPFPHRVYDSKVYPIQSPNGSTVIIYGHDFGIRILWRGGRNFKKQDPPNPAKQQNTANGTVQEDVVMILDSDDDQPASDQQAAVDLPEFEDEEDEQDDLVHPYCKFIQHVDVNMNTKVVAVSVPSILPGATRFLGSVPPFLSTTIVVTAVCSDCSIRIITLPLTPPPQTSTPSEYWTPMIVTLAQYSVQSIPITVATTFTCQKTEITNSDRRPQSRGRDNQSTSALRSTEAWYLLVATHITEASGKLSVYCVPLLESSGQKGHYHIFKGPQFPIRQLYLQSPASGIFFSPCQYPSENHSQLLLFFSNGCVKVFSCLSTACSPKIGGHQLGQGNGNSNSIGKWVLTLHTDFDPSSQNVPRRKSIVDAKWALGGTGIFALLSDGEWGVWDIENSPSTDPLSSKSAGSFGKFAITGRIAPTEGSSRPQGAAPSAIQKPAFAPQTPSTRRIREETLFRGTAHIPIQHSPRGEVCVIPSMHSLEQPSDELVLIWHGARNLFIPSLSSLRRNSPKHFGTLNHSTRNKPTPIDQLHLLGESQQGIQFLLPLPSNNDARPEILITAEHRLIILAQKTSGAKKAADQSSPERVAAAGTDDQFMLKQGELDITGMDRILTSMSGANQPASRRSTQNNTSLFA